jgi:hypothetical protein
MRRLLIAAVVTGLLAGAATQAGAALRITPEGVSLLRADRPSAPPEPVYAARPGGRYRFQVDYEVAGAARIGTGHLFVVEDAVSGRRLQVASRSFPPEPAGAYNESSTMTIPLAWEPGVYRFLWTITARNPRERSVQASGAHVFLVAG